MWHNIPFFLYFTYSNISSNKSCSTSYVCNQIEYFLLGHKNIFYTFAQQDINNIVISMCGVLRVAIHFV